MSETTLPIEAAGQDAAHVATCENCGTPLQGHYCYQCGQSAHNPLENLGHAIEEVFESFWHLDGRIFRTLRQLFVPGRVAMNYLAGHRVRYIPPLRLFVILSLLTFFVGKLVLHVGEGVRVEGLEAEIGRAQSVEEVEAIRERLLKPIEKAEQAARTPGVNPALVAQRVRIQGEAAARIVELREESAEKPGAATRTGAADKAAKPPAKVSVSPLAQDEDDPFICRFNGRPWHATANPVRVDWLPGFVNGWFNSRIGKGCENLKYAERDSERLFQQFLGAIPTALFLLMPLFALLLKLVYLGSGRSYLEHLVVALYSHGFLLLMLLAMFVLSAASNAGGPAWLTGLGFSAIWIWMPIYLWLMQKRVYRGGWFTTTLRYLVIATIYVVLVALATMSAGLMSVSS